MAHMCILRSAPKNWELQKKTRPGSFAVSLQFCARGKQSIFLSSPPVRPATSMEAMTETEADSFTLALLLANLFCFHSLVRILVMIKSQNCDRAKKKSFPCRTFDAHCKCAAHPGQIRKEVFQLRSQTSWSIRKLS